MKKKMLGIIAFAAIAAVAGWNYNQNMNNVNLSDLALENVEALAQTEQGANGCYPTICNKKCKVYIYESTAPCYCDLCSAVH